MKLLLHICCGPCASYPVPLLKAQGHDVTGYFYNPNIHPYQEWERRREGVEDLAAAEEIKVIFDDRYDAPRYLREVAFRESRRCAMCYRMRLEEVAHIARTGKFEAFTTTLLVSPYQKHDQIVEAGMAAGEKYGVTFLYQDFRPGFKEGQARARELGLYRQQYCGCIYSEAERFAPRERWPMRELDRRQDK